MGHYQAIGGDTATGATGRQSAEPANPKGYTMSIQAEMKGDTLILTIDCSKAAREKAQPSKSGKTKVLATTSGFTRIGDVSVSLNATLPLA